LPPKMTRHKKENNFLEQKVIDEKAMLAYLNNELDAQEKQQFEKMLESDPFAQEALEGLQSAKNKPVLTESLSFINKKVRDRAGVKEKKVFSIHWTNYAWAAAILGLLLGIGAVMMTYINDENTETAISQEASDGNLFESKQELSPKEPIQSIAVDTTLVQEQPSSDTQATEVAVVETVVVEEETNTTATSVPSKPSPTIPEKTVSSEKTANADQTESRKASPVKVAANVTMDDAMKSFNSGNYNESNAMFEAILQKEPSNADALYFSAIGEYTNGNLKRSEKNFDKLIKEGSKYGEGSKWYKANILLQKGNKEEAKKLLNELSQSGGSYKERAIKKMAEIHF
jgi:tetratricopeptide (TPR) repeat protein